MYHSQVMDRKILKSATVWNQLIRRSSPLDDMEEVKKLVQILKLMKDPRTQMLDLLDLICGNKAGNSFIHMFGSVKLSCPRHPDSHLVSISDFWLLEEIEGSFGTAEQKVEAVNVDSMLGPFPEFPLSARLSRQQEKMAA